MSKWEYVTCENCIYLKDNKECRRFPASYSIISPFAEYPLIEIGCKACAEYKAKEKP